MTGFIQGAGGAGGGTSTPTITIITSTDTAATLTPANNTEYRYGELTSLSLDVSSPADDYAAYIAFTSGTTATETIYPDTLKWSGDDVIDGVFTPLANRRYNIGIWYDGECTNAVARGVSI